MRFPLLILLAFAFPAQAETTTINPAAKGFKQKFTVEQWSAAQKANTEKIGRLRSAEGTSRQKFHDGAAKGTVLKAPSKRHDFWGNPIETPKEAAADFLVNKAARPIVR